MSNCWPKAAAVCLLVSGLAAGIASAQCDPTWSPGFEAPQPLGGIPVSKGVEFDDGNGPAIYVLSYSSRVYRYKNGAWAQVGTPFYGNASGVAGGRVRDIIVYNNELYICGAFQRVGTTGVTGSNGSPSSVARGVAKWSPTTGVAGSFIPASGTTFQADGIYGMAAMAIQDFGDGPKLYATGNLGGGQRLAVYNGGTSWSIIQSNTGTGINTEALVAYTDSEGPKLAIAGDFGYIDNSTAAYVASYDGTQFEEVLTTPFFAGGGVDQMAAADDGSLFLYGYGRASDEAAGRWGTVRWDGTTMHRMASTSATTAQQLFKLDDGIHPGQSLYFNGPVDGVTGLHRWTGSVAEPVVPGSDVMGSALTTFDFDGAGPLPRRFVNGTTYALGAGQWDAFPYSNADGKGGVSFELLVPYDADGAGPTPEVLVGFVTAGGMPTTPQGMVIPRVGSYDGGFVRPFGTGLEALTLDGYSLAFNDAAMFDDGNGPALYVGGSFQTLGETTLNHIMKFDGTTWTGVGGGVFSVADAELPGRHAVRALEVFNGELWVGGHFDQVGGSIAADYLAHWNGTSWTAAPAGLPGPVSAMASHDDGTGLKLYVATSQRPEAGDPAQVGVFRLDGSTWTQLGVAGYNAYSMASFNGSLYVTGNFASVDGVTYNHIARWDGTAWSPLGTGLTSAPGLSATPYRSCMIVGPDPSGTGEALYVGSRFSVADGVVTGGVAKWDGTSFSSLGNGLFNDLTSNQNPTIMSLAFYDDGRGTGLFAGGTFSRSGTVDSRNFGRFGVPTPAWRTTPADVNATAGDTVVLSLTVEPLVPVTSLQWQLDGSDVIDGGAFSGATTSTLTITGISSAEAGAYRCVMINACGTSTSPVSMVAVPSSCPACAADYDNNGGIDGSDLAAFFFDYEAGEGCADVDQNGGIDGSDLATFFSTYEAGGC